MLKSFLIKLRKKPKPVRDQAALIFAGSFTLVLFVIWLFIRLPELFNSFSSSDDEPGLLSELKEDITHDAPNLSEMREEFMTEIATSSTSTEPVFIPNEYPSTTAAEPDSNERPVRIATTSASGTTAVPTNSDT